MKAFDFIEHALVKIKTFQLSRSARMPAVFLALLFAGLPVSGYTADRLVVKNTEGSKTFRVQDDGFVFTSRSFNAQGQAPYIGLDETGPGNKSAFLVLKYKWVQLQRRAQGFGGWEATPFGIHIDAPSVSFCVDHTGYAGFGVIPAYPLEMASGAHVTLGGVWTNASSRQYKQDIKELTEAEALDVLKKLRPVKFSYKVDSEEKHVGFIAEDVPELVATRDRKGMSTMDVVAVLTKVVQEQQKTIAELSKKVAEFEKSVGLRTVAVDLK